MNFGLESIKLMAYFCSKELFKMELIIFSVLSSNMSTHKFRAKEQDIEQFLEMPLFLYWAKNSLAQE